MNTQQAYNNWAAQYDTNLNKTRDMEAIALREVLAGIPFSACLEIGCGTGKNTEWLISKADRITAVDLSEEMLGKAKAKIGTDKVDFVQADITGPWDFRAGTYDLIGFSLVLEHITTAQFDHIFQETARSLHPGGYVYIGELHPFKQYTGSKARFETEKGLQVVECFNHHISDFTDAAKKHGLMPVRIAEYFDDNDRSTIPRILALLFQKQ